MFKTMDSLHKSLACELPSLAALTPHKAVVAVVFDWTVIALAIGLARTFASVPLYGLMVLLIAGRQHALFVLTHEGAHWLLHKNQRVNDALGDLFCSFPLFIRTEAYRNHHGRHHRFLNTKEDPDWQRKISNDDWQFPRSIGSLGRVFRKYIFGFGILEILLFIYALNGLGRKNHVQKIVVRTLYYLCIASLLTFSHHWMDFGLYWLVPYTLVLPFYNRVRSIAEHFALSYADAYNKARNVHAFLWERSVFGPHDVGMHLTHHLFPNIPFYNLTKLEDLLQKIPEYHERSHINRGYVGSQGSVLHDVLTLAKTSDAR